VAGVTTLLHRIRFHRPPRVCDLQSPRVDEGSRVPRRAVTLDDLRRFAVARSLFAPTTLRRAVTRMALCKPIRFARPLAHRT
jgi:hypothetical protein